MAASDAKAIPIKAAAYRVTFDIRDADGDLVTGAASLDSEVSKDGGTFADCTNEATEIATASGMYYLDLTSTEMDADTVAVIVKTGTAGAKTTTLVLYTAARSINDLAYPTTSGRSIDVTAAGEVGVDLDNAAGTLDAAQFGADCITAAKIADGAIDAATFAAGAITATVIATDAIDADAIADGAITAGAFAAGAIDSTAIAANAIGASELADGAITAAKIATDAIDADALADGAITAATFAAGAIDAAAIATDAIGSAELAASAVTEIQSGLALAADLATVAGYIDTEVAAIITTQSAHTTALAAIQADTDNLQTRVPAALVGGRIDASVGAMAADTLTAAATATDFGTELADAVLDRAIAEPAAIHAWPASLRTIVQTLGTLFRNKQTQTATTLTVRNDADSATLWTHTVSDDGTTFTKAEGT